jgi:hypothetical protein
MKPDRLRGRSSRWLPAGGLLANPPGGDRIERGRCMCGGSEVRYPSCMQGKRPAGLEPRTPGVPIVPYLPPRCGRFSSGRSWKRMVVRAWTRENWRPRELRALRGGQYCANLVAVTREERAAGKGQAPRARSRASAQLFRLPRSGELRVKTFGEPLYPGRAARR